VIVARRKQEEINQEGQKAARQTGDRARKSSKILSTSGDSTFNPAGLIGELRPVFVKAT